VSPAALLVDHDDRAITGTGEEATATFSACRTYRYALTRRWAADKPWAVFVMLNPSTADAFTVDPTVRRCIGFARSWGAGGLMVVNAFALRSTDPIALYRHPDPIGPANDTVIAEALTGDHVGWVVTAWGAHGVLHGRAEQVDRILRSHSVRPLCLGLTKEGHPRHPLYARGDTATIDYPGHPACCLDGSAPLGLPVSADGRRGCPNCGTYFSLPPGTSWSGFGGEGR
jgi:hypothetical protein